MRFSTQNLLSLREGQSHAQVYANTLDECRLAEELGFHTVWLAEHHFSPYGIAPSLPVLAAAVARETRRVRIGTAVVVAPFAHPIRIAEEWAMVDILSEGRLEGRMLTCHAHVDHVGGHAYIKKISGTQVAMIDAEADLLQAGGKTDFHYGKVPSSGLSQ